MPPTDSGKKVGPLILRIWGPVRSAIGIFDRRQQSAPALFAETAGPLILRGAQAHLGSVIIVSGCFYREATLPCPSRIVRRRELRNTEFVQHSEERFTITDVFPN